MTITASADGSALGNPGPAGWAWYIDDDHWAAGGWKHGTNNMGELKAVLELFRATAHLDDDLHVLCDSQYVINSVTKWMRGWKAKGWRKGDGKPVLNLDLFLELDEALAGRRYRFEWVKGHVGHVLNEAADSRARAAAEAFQRGTEVPSGPGMPGAPVAGTPTGSGISGASLTATPRGTADAPEAPSRAPSSPPPLGLGDGDGELEDTLFDLEDDGGFTDVTLTLARAEHDRLSARARDLGVSPEELLRSLI